MLSTVIRKNAWTLSITLLLAQPESAQQVYFTKDSGSVLIQTQIVSRSHFSLEKIEGIARAFLAGPAATKRIAVLILGTSPDSLTRALSHGSNSGDNDDARTRQEIRELDLPDVPVARMIAMRGAALLQYRDSAMYVERLIAGTKDPSVFVLGDSRYQLLHFVLTEPGPAIPKDEFILTVFAKAHASITAATARILTTELAKVADVHHVSVRMRISSYFPEEFEYPAILPFQSDLSIPNAIQSMVESRLTCSAKRTLDVRCSGVNFAP